MLGSRVPSGCCIHGVGAAVGAEVGPAVRAAVGAAVVANQYYERLYTMQLQTVALERSGLGVVKQYWVQGAGKCTSTDVSTVAQLDFVAALLAVLVVCPIGVEVAFCGQVIIFSARFAVFAGVVR